jgi:hypothetical protein
MTEAKHSTQDVSKHKQSLYMCIEEVQTSMVLQNPVVADYIHNTKKLSDIFKNGKCARILGTGRFIEFMGCFFHEVELEQEPLKIRFDELTSKCLLLPWNNIFDPKNTYANTMYYIITDDWREFGETFIPAISKLPTANYDTELI